MSKRKQQESEQALETPVASSQDCVEAVADAISGKSMASKWRISLESLPVMDIEAENETLAINAYKSFMGIIDTEHSFKVDKVDGSV